MASTHTQKRTKTGILIQGARRTVALDRYAGQWVAFVNGKIVAHCRSLPDLMKEVGKKRVHKRPTVLLVPRKDEGPYLLFVW